MGETRKQEEFTEQEGEEIGRRIVDAKIRLRLKCLTRCDKLNEEVLNAMKEAGFWEIGFSLESAVPRVLRAIGKVQPPDAVGDDAFTREQEFIECFRRQVLLAKKKGVPRVCTSIMVGLPGETREDAGRTVDLIRSLKGSIDSYDHNVLEIWEATPLYETHGRHGYRIVRSRSGVHQRTVHPFDPARVPMAPKATHAVMNKVDHLWACQAVSGATWRKEPAGFFDRMVMEVDCLAPDTIRWLRDNLAVSGLMVWLYPDHRSAEKHHEKNVEALLTGHAPSITPLTFVAHAQPGLAAEYRPWKQRFKEQHFRSIHMPSVRVMLPGTEVPGPFHQCVLTGDGPQDTERIRGYVHDCARSIETSGATSVRAAPFFTTLCRWGGSVPDGQILEIGFVDRAGKVRPCWNGGAIGLVGTPWRALFERLLTIRRSVERSRGCAGCAVRNGCSVCVFPGGFSEAEFCSEQRTPGVRQAAAAIEASDRMRAALSPT